MKWSLQPVRQTEASDFRVLEDVAVASRDADFVESDLMIADRRTSWIYEESLNAKPDSNSHRASRVERWRRGSQKSVVFISPTWHFGHAFDATSALSDVSAVALLDSTVGISTCFTPSSFRHCSRLLDRFRLDRKP